MSSLRKLSNFERVQQLKPGDPWTIIHNGTLTIDFEDGLGPRAPEVGAVMGRWYSTAEPGRNFRITAVHPNAVETVFLGFQDVQVDDSKV